MRKIPTLYQRDPETKLRHVKPEVHPDCQWVLDGEGVATYKWDGTAVLIDDDGWPWRRRELKPGKPVPEGFSQEGEVDPNTGKLVGWVPADRDDPADRWLYEAFDAADAAGELKPGTYELVGPKVQGNPHRLREHLLVAHGDGPDLGDVPVGFSELGRWLHGVAEDCAGRIMVEDLDGDLVPPGFEGIVWHHPDGRMAKIKVRDFAAAVPAP